MPNNNKAESMLQPDSILKHWKLANKIPVNSTVFFTIIAISGFLLLASLGEIDIDSESAISVITAVAVVILLMQRWLWMLIFGIGALASAFACLASIIHFHILGAVGFFFLTFILWDVADSIADGYED